jgi:hypothetical protein
VLNAVIMLSGLNDPLGHKEAGTDAKAVCPLSLLPLLLLLLLKLGILLPEPTCTTTAVLTWLLLSVLAWLHVLPGAFRLLSAAAFSEPRDRQHSCCLDPKLEVWAISAICCCSGLQNMLLLSAKALPAFEEADGPTMASPDALLHSRGFLVLFMLRIRLCSRKPAFHAASAS